MIPLGLALLVGAAAMAAVGIVGYLSSRRSTGRSRGAALALFGHGALGTAGLLSIGSVVHIHAWTEAHLHPVGEALEDALLCDLDWSCAAWLAGIVALAVIGSSFVVSQILARRLVGRAVRFGTSAILHAGPNARVLVVPEKAPDAFSIALLRLGGRFGLRAEDYVIVTSGLMDLLTPEERQAVFEHELAHVRARDDRYLPYFHVLASVVFFDPLLKFLRDRLTRRYEFDADETAAWRTRTPRALATALLKFYEATSGSRSAVAFAGRHRSLIEERIDRLLDLAREMEARAQNTVS